VAGVCIAVMMAVVGPLHQSVDGLAENVGPAGVAESVLDRVDQGTAYDVVRGAHHVVLRHGGAA
jgi:hypothetical protein